MKAPDKILFEYASDSVTCFHGHELTLIEFGNCCDDFFKRTYGMKACYWRLLRTNGFSESVVHAFQAMDHISNELDNVLLTPGFKLNMFLKERLLGFVDPKNLLRFESEQEALAYAPRLDFEDLLKLTDAQKAAVSSMYQRNLARRIQRLTLGKNTVEINAVFGPDAGTKDDHKPTHTNFRKYLEALTGIPSIVSVDAVNASTVSVRSEETPGKQRGFKITLTSLASYTVEAYDLKTVPA